VPAVADLDMPPRPSYPHELGQWQARTDELDAGERRKIIEGGEGLVALDCRGRVLVPGAGWAEWSHKHPSAAALVCGRLP
jgi:hypothetical protein